MYESEENDLSMELILNKLSTRYSFSKLIEQFGSLVRHDDELSGNLLTLEEKFKALCQLDALNNDEAFYSTEIKTISALHSIKRILISLIEFKKQKKNRSESFLLLIFQLIFPLYSCIQKNLHS